MVKVAPSVAAKVSELLTVKVLPAVTLNPVTATAVPAAANYAEEAV